MARKRRKVGDAALVREFAERVDSVDARRALVAEMCKLLGRQLPSGGLKVSVPVSRSADEVGEPANTLPHLSPRMRQTLEQLLEGDSEKQIAQKLALSRHTVHVYVKALYKSFAVNTRSELLSLFIKRVTASTRSAHFPS